MFINYTHHYIIIIIIITIIIKSAFVGVHN
jgi:hypothetical protein